MAKIKSRLIANVPGGVAPGIRKEETSHAPHVSTAIFERWFKVPKKMAKSITPLTGLTILNKRRIIFNLDIDISLFFSSITTSYEFLD
jgi:hypothetical protein